MHRPDPLDLVLSGVAFLLELAALAWWWRRQFRAP